MASNMATGKPLVKQTVQSVTNDIVSSDLTSVDESAGFQNQFQLEGLEPRILLSGDPVLAELARVLDTDNHADAAHQPAALVYELDADLSADLGLGAERDPAARLIESDPSDGPNVDWPEAWKTAELTSNSGAESAAAEVSEIDDDDSTEVPVSPSAKTTVEQDFAVTNTNLEKENNAPLEGIAPFVVTTFASAATTEEQQTVTANVNEAVNNPSSLTTTESIKTSDVNDDSIARAPPVYDAIQTAQEDLENNTVPVVPTVFLRSETTVPVQAQDDAEKQRAPPVEDTQPRAPPAAIFATAIASSAADNDSHHDGASAEFNANAAAAADEATLVDFFSTGLAEFSALFGQAADLFAQLDFGLFDTSSFAEGCNQC